MTNDIVARLRLTPVLMYADKFGQQQIDYEACKKYINNEGIKMMSEAANEIERLRAERDEVRQSYCSLMEAYRGGDGRVTANKLGWGYLFEEDKPCQ